MRRTTLATALTYDPAFTGGVPVAAGNAYADGEVAVSLGPGGGPHVRLVE